MEIEKIRKEIDKVDDKIINFLSKKKVYIHKDLCNKLKGTKKLSY